MLTTRRLGSEAQLQDASENRAPLARGSSGTGVGQLQDLLVDLGFAMPRSVDRAGADGIFGSETDTVVRSFQQQLGLTADGIVGRKTLGALEAIIQRNSTALETPSPIKEAASWQIDAVAPFSQKRAAYL